MNLDHIAYFIEVAETKSLNLASKNLYISYSAVAKSMQSLENELHCKLLERSHQGVYLTPQGELFYQDALKIAEMRQRWETFSDGSSGHAIQKITLLTTVYPYFTILADILPALRNEYKKAEYYFRILPDIEIQNALLDTKNDARIALTSCRGDNSALKAFCSQNKYQMEFLYNDNFYAFISADLPESKKDSISLLELKKLPAVLPNADAGAQDMYPQISQLKENEIIYMVSSIEGILQTIVSKKAVSILGKATAKKAEEVFADKIRVLPIKDFNLSMQYYMLHPSKTKCTPEERNVIERIKKFAGKL